MARSLAAGLAVAAVAAVVGTFVAGLLAGLGGGSSPALLLLAPAVGAATAAGARWRAARLLERATADEHDARSGLRALIAGAGLAGPPLALLAGGEPVWLAAPAWTALLAVGAATGVALASRARPDRRSELRVGLGRRLRGETGAVTTETVAVVVVIAAVLAALFALALPTRVGDWGQYAVCSILGDDCERPGHETASQAAADWEDWEPDRCTRSSREQFVDASLGITWVDLGTRQGYTTLRTSDDTYRVVYTGSGSIGASKSAGVYLDIYAGEETFSSGAMASAGGALRFEDGVAWDFDNEQDAQDWIEWHLAEGLVPEVADNAVTRAGARQLLGPAGDVLVSGGRDSLFGTVWGKGVEAGNWALNQVGLGRDVPPEPDVAEVFSAGGVELEAEARLGYLFAGDTEVSAGNVTQLGTSQRSDGDRTVYLEVETQLLAHAGLNLGPEAQAGYNDRSVVTVTLDEDDRPKGVELQVHRAGEAGRDFADVDDPRAALAGAWDADAGDEPLDHSLYEINVAMDLDPDDHDGLGDVVAALTDASGAAMPGRPGATAQRLFDEGTVSVVEYADTERLYGGGVGGAYSAEISGSLVAGDHRLDAVASHFFDRNTDAFRPWFRCTG